MQVDCFKKLKISENWEKSMAVHLQEKLSKKKRKEMRSRKIICNNVGWIGGQLSHLICVDQYF